MLKNDPYYGIVKHDGDYAYSALASICVINRRGFHERKCNGMRTWAGV